MKIVYCLNSIAEDGGIAKVTVTKANVLAEIPHNEVFLCVSDHKENYLSGQISHKVTLVDLNIDYYSDDWKSRFNVLKGIVLKRKKHKKVLRKVLQEINPDIVISVGQCEKYFLPKIKNTAKTIREFHYAANYRSLIAKGFIGKLIAHLENLYDYRWKIKNYDQIVVLTDEDMKLNWGNNKKVTVIPNPLTFSTSGKSSLTNKKIITLGRLVNQKNHASLITAFSKVVKHHPDWTLEIYGKGGLKKALQKQIETLNLSDNVKLKGGNHHPRELYLESSIFVLSSKFEGFGVVLIEAMECGVPVVSYDCPCGPKDIITDGTDGFLVPYGNEEFLAEKICYLIEHPQERLKMGMAAQAKAEKYSEAKIAAQWMSLFKSLC